MPRGHSSGEQEAMRKQRIADCASAKEDAVLVCRLLCEGKVVEAKVEALKVIHRISKASGPHRLLRKKP